MLTQIFKILDAELYQYVIFVFSQMTDIGVTNIFFGFGLQLNRKRS